MTQDDLWEYCGSKPGAVLEFPFDERTPVWKVKGKMFALSSVGSEQLRVNLKCDPGLSRDLRAQNPSIIPGYHMNKEHWNTIILDRGIDDDLVRKLIDLSYDLVSHPKISRQGRNT